VAERSQERELICVARIGAAHGVRGEVKLWSFTADPAAVADYGPFETPDGRVVEIETMRPAKEFFVARLKGVADRDAAERLRNVELLVPRERLPVPAEADEFYHADLIGLAVVDTAGTALGSVVAVHNFGAGDLIEVRSPQRRDTVMLAFSQAVVPEIDLAGGRVVVAAEAFEAASAPTPGVDREQASESSG
jgi:16S rRNA processing protein RimM